MNGDIMFKSAVNGFNREDVLNYIGQLKAEFHTYKTEAEKKSAELEKRIAELEAQLSEGGACKTDMADAPDSCEADATEEACTAESENGETAEFVNLSAYTDSDFLSQIDKFCEEYGD